MLAARGGTHASSAALRKRAYRVFAIPPGVQWPCVPLSLSLLLILCTPFRRTIPFGQDLSALSYTSIMGVLGTVYTATVMGIRYFDNRYGGGISSRLCAVCGINKVEVRFCRQRVQRDGEKNIRVGGSALSAMYLSTIRAHE